MRLFKYEDCGDLDKAGCGGDDGAGLDVLVGVMLMCVLLFVLELNELLGSGFGLREQIGDSGLVGFVEGGLVCAAISNLFSESLWKVHHHVVVDGFLGILGADLAIEGAVCGWVDCEDVLGDRGELGRGVFGSDVFGDFELVVAVMFHGWGLYFCQNMGFILGAVIVAKR